MASKPPRGSPPPSSGKPRAVRIKMDYYKGRDRMGWLRLGLVALAPLAALGWWFGEYVASGGRADDRVSRGEVGPGHSMWETQCEACHEPFVPIKSDSPWPRSATADADRKCQTCHTGSGPPRLAAHARCRPAADATATTAAGTVTLVAMSDTKCAVCHADLRQHRPQKGPADYETSGTRRSPGSTGTTPSSGPTSPTRRPGRDGPRAGRP